MKLAAALLIFGLSTIHVKGQEEACDCTVYYLCDAANTVSSSTKCSGPEVCCRAETTKSPIVTAPPRPTPKEIFTESPPKDSTCVCVPPSECPEVSGAGLLNLKNNFGCAANQVLCCRGDQSSEENKGQPGGGGNLPGGAGNVPGGGDNPPGGDVNGCADGLGGAGDDCGEIPPFSECGVRRSPNNQLTNKITGVNTETFFAEFPWMMAILTNRVHKNGSISENVFQCGATLILPSVVMTAAHCVDKIQIGNLKVRGGEWDTSSNNDIESEPFPYHESTVSRVHIHEFYEASSVYNDIALLFLDFPFPVKDHIGQICTPNYLEEYDPNSCLVTGWGKDKFGVEGVYHNTLRKVDLKIVPRDECQAQLRKTRLGKYFNLHESFLCASGGPNQDSCKGDGGGPLICKMRNDPTRYTQVGIVAWGIGCGNETPGVYVDVFKFKKWILDNSHSGQKVDLKNGLKNKKKKN